MSVSCGLAVVGLPVLALTGGAVAQEGTTADNSIVLDTVVITGRKRTEVEEKAPVSATIIGSEEIPASALDAGAAITRQAPNTNFIDYTRFGETFINIRGVSTLGSPLNSLDSTVGYSIDGVPTSVGGFAAPLLDVEQIEVLRGPQGTTFGRNALAGAVNVVNRHADGERELRVDTEVGSNGHAFIQGTAGGWLMPDTVAGRAAIRLQKYDGDIRNPFLGEHLGDAKLGAARGTLRFTPDDTLTIDVTGSYSRDERANPAYLRFDIPGFPISGEDVRPENERTISQGTITIRKEFDKFSFTSTTSYQDIGIYNYGDFTDAFIFGGAAGVPPEFMLNPLNDKIATKEDERIFTQEFRLNSADAADWQWVVGASYLHSDYNFDRVTGTDFFPTLNGVFDNDVVSDTYAAFGDVTVPLGEGWEVSGGLRVSRDRQTFDGNYVSNGYPGTLPFFTQSGEISDTYVTGRAALSYQWSDDVMSYGSIARGYSSGGFEKTGQYAPFGIASPPFRPARGWTYELGTKATVADRVMLRGAVFYNDISDGQLSGFDVSTLQVFMTNQDFRSYGVELGGSVELTDGLELVGGLGYTKSEMVHVTPQSMLPGAREGNAVPQVPEWTANIGLNYKLPGSTVGVSGDFAANVNYRYTGTRFSDLANLEKMDAYHIVNARIGWDSGKFGIHAFVNNLLDERPLSYSFNFAPDVKGVYVAGRGRVFGIGATMKW
ncbi:TonB-dependent receptor [Phyllobacterium sp. SB3]|uniref:TonB-dependent receptor n=1 Tax=Phyllobacterium sp. SB3 TaxID=3156073 RepID=UPI0032AFC68A